MAKGWFRDIAQGQGLAFGDRAQGSQGETKMGAGKGTWGRLVGGESTPEEAGGSGSRPEGVGELGRNELSEEGSRPRWPELAGEGVWAWEGRWGWKTPGEGWGEGQPLRCKEA